MSQPVQVFITVDTEIWPRTAALTGPAFEEDYRREILGTTSRGDYGIGFQMELMNRHGLKGVFFIEALFASSPAGLDPLRRIVDLVHEKGHEVQLHIHTEWLDKGAGHLLPGRTGQHLRHFDEEEQTLLLAQGLKNLREAGAPDVNAHRAGNYGANWATLPALARNGIRYDTSHNATYLELGCDMPTDELFLQPAERDGVWEFPITWFEEGTGRRRHVQIAACSAAELEHALTQAHAQNWYSLVLVSHGFELIHRRQPRPDRVAIRRFERFCQVLADHPDRWRTAGFHDVDPAAIPAEQPQTPLRSNLLRTVGRTFEQALRRCFD